MEKGSRVREDEVLPDWDRDLLLCRNSQQSFSAGFQEANPAPRNARVLPAESPSRSCVCMSEQASVFACRPVGCNRLDINIYIHIRVHALELLVVSCLWCCRTVIPVCSRVCACASASIAFHSPLSQLFLGPRPRWSRLALHARA